MCLCSARRTITYTCRRENTMTWEKPDFEALELCMEITTYAHQR